MNVDGRPTFMACIVKHALKISDPESRLGDLIRARRRRVQSPVWRTQRAQRQPPSSLSALTRLTVGVYAASAQPA